uniref:TLC domain-containing protein n=1 Tax=Chelydra serpentina TaxID=8475 RepID=A0A8C3T1V5_CHESE
MAPLFPVQLASAGQRGLHGASGHSLLHWGAEPGGWHGARAWGLHARRSWGPGTGGSQRLMGGSWPRVHPPACVHAPPPPPRYQPPPPRPMPTPHPLTACASRGDPYLVKLNVAITCGYLLYDLLLLLRYWKTLGDSLFVCHHLVALYAYGYVLSRGVLPYFANFRLLSELSTPFVNLRWFFDTVGQPRSSWFVLANGMAMTVVFFLVRIAIIPSYYARVLAWHGTPEYTRLGLAVQVAWIVPSLALEVLNLVWMYKIVRGFYRAFCRPQERKAAYSHGD